MLLRVKRLSQSRGAAKKVNNPDYQGLCGLIGYNFRDSSLLENALTHSSYCYEHKLRYRENNERLEFLGDAVLDAVIAEEMYYRLAENEEGDLSKLRSAVVCEESLLRKAEDLGLSQYIRMGRGEESSGSKRKKRSLVADAVEATLGAIYLDGGWESVKEVILRLFDDIIQDALAGRLRKDYKTALQEFLQSGGGAAHISYRIEDEKGPDHDKTFYAVLRNKGQIIGRGSGSTKKAAEQNAAKEALEKLQVR